MRSPAAAFAWEFRQRHRWGFLGVVSYLLTTAAYKLLVLGHEKRVNFENDQTFALVVIVPLSATFMYFLAVFTFGLAGDIAARQSMFPTRMFTLPVTSGALAGWPMLYGSLAMTVLWLATRLMSVWPAGVEVPVVWPALLAASLLAWTQALTWLPYPLRGLRVIVVMIWMAVLEAAVVVALEFKATEPVMLAILAPHVPLAWLVARSAVARARRGDVPDWRRIFAPFEPLARVVTRRQKNFSSPARAQAWFEWRQYGRSLPALVALIVPLELALLFAFSETPVIIFETILFALYTPPFMAAFVAATVSKSNPNQGDSYGVTPFLATRPLASASLIAAKLKVTVWSTVAAYLIVLAAIPLALQLSGTWPFAIDWMNHAVQIAGKRRAIVFGVLVLVVLMITTWKQLVQNLYVGMSGRGWVVKASVFGTLSLLAILFPLVLWIHDSRSASAALWKAFPWILVFLVCIKTLAAVWVALRLHDRELVSDRTLLIGAITWNVVVLSLYGVLAWLIPTLIIRHYVLALIAILIVPLARLSAAPLAIHWNRHR